MKLPKEISRIKSGYYMVNFINRFKSLPISTRRLLSVSIIIAFVIALPLFIWAIVTQKFLITKRAASGEPGVCVAQNNTILVTPSSDTNGTCHSIQGAIDAVNGSGFTIQIAAGNYSESSTINVLGKTNLTITGDQNSNGNTQINFTSDGWGFKVSSSSGTIEWLTASGFTPNGLMNIENSQNFSLGYDKFNATSSHAIDINGSNNISIFNTDVQSSAGAIEAGSSDGIHVLNNKIHNSQNAIAMINVSGVEIIGNLINSNNQSAISIQDINSLNVNHNTIINNTLETPSLHAVHLYGNVTGGINFTNNIIAANTGIGVGHSSTNIAATFQNNDVWNNDSRNYIGFTDQTGTNGNISADPQINSTPGYGFCLDSNSPAIYGNPANGEYMGYIGPCSNYPTPSPLPSSSPSPAPTCEPRPACLDTTPRCLPPVPAGGWCPNSSPTPSPTVRPFTILFKFQGVDGDGASYAKLGNNAAKVTVRFLSQALNYALGYVTPPVTADYIGNGVYALHFGIWSTNLPAGSDYSITLKGEKHVATKFCQESGQTTHCATTGTIQIPENPLTEVNLDFTGIPLQPGDVYPQDGAVTTLGTSSDLARILSLLAKPPSTLATQDLLTGDLDYNGVINIKDLYLLRQTLQTRYDEN